MSNPESTRSAPLHLVIVAFTVLLQTLLTAFPAWAAVLCGVAVIALLAKL